MIWIDWFTPNHASEVKHCFNNSLESLRRSQLPLRVLKAWLREAIAKDIETWPEEEKEIKEIEEQWWKSKRKAPSENDNEERINYLERIHLTEELLRKELRIELACQKWAKETWVSSLPQIFLDTKDKFDEVTFNMMRLPSEDKNLANELYHRLKAGEEKFEKIAMAYGHGPERLPGGALNKLMLNIPQPQLTERLKRMNPGELSLPFIVAEWVLIVEMKSTKPATLDADIEKILIDKALDRFLRFGVTRIADSLCEPVNSDSNIKNEV